jgi:phosphatidylethanolamine/phosphatidyl-N-methylethanolamine N-methyltransferase
MIIDSLPFLVEFARNPLCVGAIAPSGAALADRITAPIRPAGDPVVVELGAGTGAFTAAIQRRLAGRGTHVAVEVNPRFAARLSARYPHVDVVDADAADLGAVLELRGLPRADVVVSGLPWAAFPAHRQQAILREAVAALADDGTFTTFAYVHAIWTPPARRFRRALSAWFGDVRTDPVVWPNLPPALTYVAHRPHRPAQRRRAA